MMSCEQWRATVICCYLCHFNHWILICNTVLCFSFINFLDFLFVESYRFTTNRPSSAGVQFSLAGGVSSAQYHRCEDAESRKDISGWWLCMRACMYMWSIESLLNHDISVTPTWISTLSLCHTLSLAPVAVNSVIRKSSPSCPCTCIAQYYYPPKHASSEVYSKPTCRPSPVLAEHGNICHCLSRIVCRFRPAVIWWASSAFNKSCRTIFILMLRQSGIYAASTPAY